MGLDWWFGRTVEVPSTLAPREARRRLESEVEHEKWRLAFRPAALYGTVGLEDLAVGLFRPFVGVEFSAHLVGRLESTDADLTILCGRVRLNPVGRQLVTRIVGLLVIINLLALAVRLTGTDDSTSSAAIRAFITVLVWGSIPTASLFIIATYLAQRGSAEQLEEVLAALLNPGRLE